MSRTTTIAVVVCGVVVTGVIAWTAHIVRQERAAAIAQLSADRLRTLQAVAHEVDKDFENIGAVLRFAGQLFATADTSTERERELGALVTVGGPYLLAVVYDVDARRVLEVPCSRRAARARCANASSTSRDSRTCTS